ncbi:MAG: hypothetical protein LBV74_02440 [Tannerella sp.]|jgi:hypothetical protein|nr:hypothetical protein [Tannerella sp.]
MNKAAKLVSSSVIGIDIRVFTVNSKQYTVQPPTIYKISAAISCLCNADLDDKPTVKEILYSLKDSSDSCAKALSWFINGDESLYDELKHGTLEEVVDGLEAAISLIPAQVFLKAVNLARNVASLAAKPKL